MTVSVIVPVYNGAAYVRTAITSVLAQTDADLEVIVVDDGSTDGTADVVRPIGDQRVRLVVRENGGPSAARNTGFAVARGEWVAVLDSDDWWAPEKLAAQLARAAERPAAALIYTSATVVDMTDRPIEYLRATADGEGRVLDTLLHRNLVVNSSVLVRAAVLRDVGGWDETLRCGEDWDLWLRIAALHPVTRVDAPLTFYRCRAASQGSDAERMRDSCLRLLERAFASYAHDRLALRRRALAEVYYQAAIQFQEQDQKGAASRELLRAISYYPGHRAAYRRLLRLAVSSPPHP